MIFCGKELQILDRDDRISGSELRSVGKSRSTAGIEELLPILCDPNTKEPLQLKENLLVSSANTYRILENGLHLYPVDIKRIDSVLASERFLNDYRSLPPMEQYFLISALKASMGTNLDIEDPWYERHLWRSCQLLANARGRYLDIGCDDPWLSRGMLSEDVDYVGLDPSASDVGAFSIHGFSEFLPFNSNSFDAIGFQTSLDHIFDFRLAINEACRVLLPQGRLYLATLLWTGVQAQMYTDTVHFHHFRSSDIEEALGKDFDIESASAYSWKGDSHRFGVYLTATKRLR